MVTLCFKWEPLPAQQYRNGWIPVSVQVKFEHLNGSPWKSLEYHRSRADRGSALWWWWWRWWGWGRWGRWVMLETRQSCLIWANSQSCCIFSQRSHVHDLHYWKHAAFNGDSDSFKHEVSLNIFFKYAQMMLSEPPPPLPTTMSKNCYVEPHPTVGPQSVSRSSHHANDPLLWRRTLKVPPWRVQLPGFKSDGTLSASQPRWKVTSRLQSYFVMTF